MIEVNLLPGGRKGGGGGSPLAGLVEGLKGLTSRGGGGGGGGQMDPYMGFFAVAAAITLGYMGFSFMNLRSETEELNLQLEAFKNHSHDELAEVSHQRDGLQKKCLELET